MILPKVRDPRFITVRRGGSLEDHDHHLLALWAADSGVDGGAPPASLQSAAMSGRPTT